MRPVRIITAVAFAAAVAATGCTAHSTAADPSAVAAAPGAAAPASPAPKLPTPAPQPGAVAKQPTPAPKPLVLADGRYDAFIRQVNTRGDYLVVDLVQVFEGQAAVNAAVADGQSRDTAQYLPVYVRNQNPRLRTLPLASDLRLDLQGGCEEPISHQLAKLAEDARAMSGVDHTDHMYYFTLTVAGGAVHRVQEFLAINAC